MQKATLAYAVTPDAGNFWSRPEIRVYTAWLQGSDKDATFSAGTERVQLTSLLVFRLKLGGNPLV